MHRASEVFAVGSCPTSPGGQRREEQVEYAEAGFEGWLALTVGGRWSAGY